MPRATRLTPALLLALCSTALGIDQAQQNLQNAFPGVRFHHDQGRLLSVYGIPMTAGPDARTAAQTWISTYGDVFGAGQLSLGESWSAQLPGNTRTVFTYQQYIGGIPVEYGMLKVLVQHQPINQVVYAAGTLAPAPAEGSFPAPRLTAEEALNSIRSLKAWSGLPIWSAPTLVIYQGDGDWRGPILTWKFTAENPNPAMAVCRTFFVDALTGGLVASRNEVAHTDITGAVKGMGSPGVLPDIASNPPAPLDMPNIRVSVAGGNSAFANASGVFSILHPGSTAVDVSTGVAAPTYGGQWVNVQSAISTAPNIVSTLPGVVPPGPANFLLNPTPSEHLTSQINAFVGITLTHNYFKDRAPTFTALDHAIRTNTSVSGSCNANFSAGATPPTSSQINMYRSGGGCPNMGFSTILSHEYGHFVVNRLNRPQGSFGEGFGDMTGCMVWDDQVSGREVFGPGTVGRDPIASNIQYPCTQEIHTCGMALSGVWWRIRTAMGTAFGSAPGLEMTRNLNVAWALITVGGSGNDAIHPATAIEVLTADDNDGNINNGTPNYSRICPSFASHNVQCPQLSLLSFAYPSGRPASIPANAPFNFPVNVSANAAQPLAGSGMLHYRLGSSGPFTSIPMTQGAPNQYTAALPATPCGNILNYYVSSQTTSSTTGTDPGNAPTSTFSTIVGTIQQNNILSVDFNGSLPAGWTGSGMWHISSTCAPSGTPCAGPQAAYYGQDASCNFATASTANSGSLSSPPIQLPPAVPGGSLKLSYCYALITENATSYDKATVLINGVQVDRAPDSADWQNREIDIASYAGQNITISFKFDSVDGVNNNFRGWHVDNVRIFGSTIACNTCYANCDGSTIPPVLNVNDFVCFQTKYAAGDPTANCDGSTIPPVLNVNDFVCFQTQYAAGCP